MPTNITEVGPNQGSQFQGRWLSFAQACYRPAPDLNLPILCKVQMKQTRTNSTIYITGSEGGNYELFKPCCGPGRDEDPEDPRRHVYSLQKKTAGEQPAS